MDSRIMNRALYVFYPAVVFTFSIAAWSATKLPTGSGIPFLSPTLFSNNSCNQKDYFAFIKNESACKRNDKFQSN